MKTKFLLGGLVVAGSSWLVAAPLAESTFTEVVKEVNVVAAATKAATTASVKAVVKAPDLVRTGPESRAELTAPDQTITRVGANTVFSFEPAGRTIDLQQGSLLFHSPSGKGGGTIKSGGAAAAVLGTTIIVVATPGGGFKVIVLEGKGKVTLPTGKTITLKHGQLVVVLPDGTTQVFDINLDKLVGGSLLVNGFSGPLPSLDKIREAIQQQQELLAKGRAVDTGFPPDHFGDGGTPGNGLNGLDNNIYGAGQGPQRPGLVQGPKTLGFPPLPIGNGVITTVSSTTISGGVSSSVILPLLPLAPSPTH